MKSPLRDQLSCRAISAPDCAPPAAGNPAVRSGRQADYPFRPIIFSHHHDCDHSQRLPLRTFSYHQELELDIDALSNAGDGIGRVDGWVVFVPFALPGDRVKARVWRNDKNYSSADLVEIINPSQDRVEPGCRLFGTCGGCQYQHLSYDRQLLWKPGR